MSDDYAMSEVVTVKEAAERLGISKQAVLKRIHKGTLTAEKFGWQWMIPVDALKD